MKSTTKEILRPKYAAAYLGVSTTTLWRLEQQSGFPNKIRISNRCCAFRRVDLDNWLASKEV
ncbi:AlpA family phage regulatory protein [Pseudoalteromonas sp. S2893]|uniref:helix-turn-helix transcriptional regulator n=1 Tax=Pseudoalteromonas sp. S2893 TaxID=579530 RepID=UPI00110A1594|nr:AlpA family phage regulatory protein [Pseudoalteromonas sp. S2893]TMP14439.1 hypothetical protein CWC04_16600 [Pseudoalteromonas sp. S2893]